jgi:hypothetical protein
MYTRLENCIAPLRVLLIASDFDDHERLDFFSHRTTTQQNFNVCSQTQQSDLNKVISSCNDFRINSVVFPYFILGAHTLPFISSRNGFVAF